MTVFTAREREEMAKADAEIDREFDPGFEEDWDLEPPPVPQLV